MANIRKRKSAGGKVSYQVQIRRLGHKALTRSFTRKEDATKWANQTEVQVERGTAGLITEAHQRSVGEAIDKYLQECNATKDAAPRRQQLLWWKSRVGHLSLAGLTRGVLSECKQELKTTKFKRGKGADAKEYTKSAATINRYLAALSHMLNQCVEWEWLAISPMAKFSKEKEPRGRDRFLTPEERTALLGACKASGNPILHTVVLVALNTGARRNEIMSLRWSSIDLKKKIAIALETKNGSRRALYLSGDALNALTAMHEAKVNAKVRRIDESDLVFPSPTDPQRPMDIQSAWEVALKKAGLEKGFRFHDLRHSAASALAMNGAGASEIASVLGHRTLQMVARYAHLSESHAQAVVEAMVAKMEASTSASRVVNLPVATTANEGQIHIGAI